MTATDTMEQRKNIRLGVQPDQAQVTVLIDGAQQPGVLVNQSSEGFGLMLQRGTRIDPGHPVRVVSSDGVHECRVCHIRPDDGYQLLGMQRITDVPFIERPKKHQAKRWFRHAMGGGLASCVVLGLGVMGCVWCVWNGPPEKNAEDRAAEQQTAAGQSPGDLASTEDQLENRERLLELAQSSDSSSSLSAAFFSRLTGYSAAGLKPKLTQRGLDWNSLTKELALSSTQQDSIRRLLTSSTATTPATARAQLRSILNGPQKSKVDRIAADL